MHITHSSNGQTHSTKSGMLALHGPYGQKLLHTCHLIARGPQAAATSAGCIGKPNGWWAGAQLMWAMPGNRASVPKVAW